MTRDVVLGIFGGFLSGFPTMQCCRVRSGNNVGVKCHLMGKKSTDEQARLEDPGGDDESVLASTGQYDMQPAFVRALEALFREKAEQRSAQRSARVSAQKDNAVHLLNRLLSTPRQLVEGRERDSRREQVEQLLSQALDMKDESS
ncbi:gastrin-releasing peptide isoform X2 [Paramisgurnus dabryanus]|uniref:gastrin-releasing peptide isoform X2 n=1 Tax=Paramisgurnus dabryanus TaxID=90735 RepID=UPI0031F3D497